MRRVNSARAGAAVLTMLVLAACSGGSPAATGSAAGQPQRTTVAVVTSVPPASPSPPVAASPSPDAAPAGTILFAREFGQEGAGGSQLMTVRPDGTHLSVITHLDLGFASNPTWSADHRSVLFDLEDRRHHRGTLRIYSVPVTGGTPTRVTDGQFDVNPSAAPDGQHIVFARAATGDDPTSLYVMGTDGSHATQITHGHGDYKPTYSPDGTQIAFIRGGGVDVMNADGTGIRELAGRETQALGVHWSPDGRSVVYDDHSVGDGVTTIADVASGATSSVKFVGDPSFSPDGTLILGNIWQGEPWVGLATMHLDGSGISVFWHPTPERDIFPNFPTWVAD